jgi:N-acetyl-anhydromuramyl-L-alanine amidase AmpD
MYTDQILENGEYFKKVTKKDTICIHHTAGGHRPDWTIAGWEKDANSAGAQLPVATPYVIGGKSISDGNTDFNGKIYRCHDDQYWAHHLGCKVANNTLLNEKCVGIEICNYGALTKTSAGYLNYVNKIIPADQVVTLAKPFRGSIYWHAYTPEQIHSLKELLLDISTRHKIDLKKGLKPLIKSKTDWGIAFDISQAAISGAQGLWTHTSYRADKIDCSPQPLLLEMILSL